MVEIYGEPWYTLKSHRLVFDRGSQMLQNTLDMDFKMSLIESGQTQTEVAEKLGVSLSYVNCFSKGAGSRSSIRPS
ncbi:MAG: hypothetical protein IIY58_02625 [Aeriscardovia sp.]|nr:hypothetical protein [Aeriscardovia sp.]